jgi:hypothetical protein
MAFFSVFGLKATTTYFLEGTIGNSPICMRFEDFTESYPNEEPRITDIRYFYLSSLKDIVLEGIRMNDQFTFYFNQNDGKFDEKFVLTKDTKGVFKGNWFHKSGKKLPVTLQPINAATVKTHSIIYLSLMPTKTRIHLNTCAQASLTFEQIQSLLLRVELFAG